MNRFLYISIAMIAMAAIAFGADNSLGTWNYNTAKSKSASGASPIKNLTVTREAAAGGAKITAKGERADGSKINTVTNATYDGKEVTVTGEGLTWDTASTKQINADTFTEERSKKGGKYHATVRTVISKDGKTMTSSSKGTNAEGKAFASVAVFDKQ